MSKRLIVFAKEPEAGKVKTRLMGYLTGDQCVALYKAFLMDTVATAKNVICDERILAYDPGGDPSYLRSISEGFELLRQEGDDLGQRMHNAFTYKQGVSPGKTVIIGSDSPTLPAAHIDEAFRHLDRFDMVLGPSFDGGYYLIGLNRPCADLFMGIEWSSKSVKECTLQKAGKLNLSVSLLQKWHDIDLPEDIERLRSDEEGIKARHTKEVLKMLKIGCHPPEADPSLAEAKKPGPERV